MRLLAIDPGVRLHGWCVLERVEPRVFAVRLWGHSDYDTVAALIRDTDTLGDMRVAVESAAGAMFGASRSPWLLKSVRQGAKLAAVAEEHGREVLEVRAEVWRKFLIGSQSAKNADDRISFVLQASARPGGMLRGLPGETEGREHVYDAIGFALAAMRDGPDRLRAFEAELDARDCKTTQKDLPGLGTKRRAKR